MSLFQVNRLYFIVYHALDCDLCTFWMVRDTHGCQFIMNSSTNTASRVWSTRALLDSLPPSEGER